MKGKHNEGFSLAEVLVSMAILTAIVIPVCTGLTLCARMDAKAEAVLRARIAVSSAVEQLKAEGITHASVTPHRTAEYDVVETEGGQEDRLPNVRVYTTEGKASVYYKVVVTDNNELVTVETFIRAAEEG